MSATHTEEAHTGPIKNPRQLLIAVFFSFVVPVFVIIGLVQYVSSADKSGAGASQTEMAKAQRLQKIGLVEIRDANRPCARAKRSTRASAPLATPRALQEHPSSRMLRPGALALHRDWKAWCTRHSRARAPWPLRVAATSTTPKLHAAWSTWPTQRAASSKNPRPLPQKAPRQKAQQPRQLSNTRDFWNQPASAGFHARAGLRTKP